MKTNKSFFTFVGLGALALALGLNFIYATNDYGISNNTLSLYVLAQTNSSGGGSTSGSTSGSSTGTGTGKNKFFEEIKRVQDKVTKSCDGLKHTEKTEPGFKISCKGTGTLDCYERWYSDPTKSVTTTSSNCYGIFCP